MSKRLLTLQFQYIGTENALNTPKVALKQILNEMNISIFYTIYYSALCIFMNKISIFILTGMLFKLFLYQLDCD